MNETGTILFSQCKLKIAEGYQTIIARTSLGVIGKNGVAVLCLEEVALHFGRRRLGTYLGLIEILIIVVAKLEELGILIELALRVILHTVLGAEMVFRKLSVDIDVAL